MLRKCSIRDQDGILSNVLIVKKTPRYERLKNTPMMEIPYVKDVLLKNW